MQLIQFSNAVTELRRWVEALEPSPRYPKKSAIELIDLGSNVVDSLSEPQMVSLMTRTKQYSLMIHGDVFQDMCDLVRLQAVRLWRATATHAGKKHGLPFDEEYSIDEYWGVRSIAIGLTDEPGWPPAKPFPCSSRFGRIEACEVASKEEPKQISLLTAKAKGWAIGQDLPRFICRLEEIAAYFESKAAEMQDESFLAGLRLFWRVTCWFFDTLTRADKTHLRGSWLLATCKSITSSEDKFTVTAAYAREMVFDLKDASQLILAAAELLVPQPDGKVNVPWLPPTSSVDEVIEPDRPANQIDTNDLEVTQTATQTSSPGGIGELPTSPSSPEPNKSEDEDDESKTWASAESRPPDRYIPIPLAGKIWQIAWALQQAEICDTPNPDEMKSRINARARLWGKQVGSEYEVYVLASTEYEKKLNRALEALRTIKTEWYYPEGHELPKGFKYENVRPLQARSENILAEVLHQVGILTNSAVIDLRKALMVKKRKKLICVISKERDLFSIYLHKDHHERLEQAERLLDSITKSV